MKLPGNGNINILDMTSRGRLYVMLRSNEIIPDVQLHDCSNLLQSQTPKMTAAKPGGELVRFTSQCCEQTEHISSGREGGCSTHTQISGGRLSGPKMNCHMPCEEKVFFFFFLSVLPGSINVWAITQIDSYSNTSGGGADNIWQAD